MKQKLQCTPAICTIPVGESSEFRGIIDLIDNKFVLKDETDKTNQKYSLVDIPASHRDEAAMYREQLLETASLADDELAEMILEGKDIPKEKLLSALRKGTIEGRFNPIYCGSSKNFHGVQVLLDAVVNFLPSPLDRPPVDGINPKTKEAVQRKPDAKEPFSGLAFKTVAEPTGDRLYRMMGNTRQELDEAQPGAIVAVVGLKNTYTGNTLCDPDAPVALESISFPKPVISAALGAARTVDTGKLGEALSRMTKDDPTVKVHTDEETKDTILSGMGELNLETTLEKIKRSLNLPQGDPALSLGKPRVAYRQTLARPIEFQTRFIKQTGGRGKFAVINMRYTPLDAEGIERCAAEAVEEGEKPDPNNVYFKSEIVGGVVPKEYIPSVEDGIRNMAKKGSKYPFPFVDLECALFDGKYHDVDSSQDAFRLAAEENFRDVQM